YLAITDLQDETANQVGINFFDKLDFFLLTVTFDELFKLSPGTCIKRAGRAYHLCPNPLVLVVSIIEFASDANKNLLAILPVDDLKESLCQTMDLTLEHPLQHRQLLIVLDDWILQQKTERPAFGCDL